MLRQHKFLNDIMERLNNEEDKNTSDKSVIEEINSVRKILTNPKNMALYIAANVDKLAGQFQNVYEPWKILLPDEQTPCKSR